MNAPRPPKRNAGRGGRRPAGRAGAAADRPGGDRSGSDRSASDRPGADRPGAGRSREPVPGVRVTGGRPPALFDRGRALRVLGGLFAFTLGFAVAGVLVVAGLAATVPYYAALAVGIAGLILVGFATTRGLPPMPQTPIWSRATLSYLAESAALPAVPVIAVLYALTAIGVLGNIVDPLVFGVD